MKAVVVASPIGLFVYSDDRITEFLFFPKNPREIAQNLWQLLQNESVEATRVLSVILNKKGYTELTFEDSGLAYSFPWDGDSFVVECKCVTRIVSSKLEKIATEKGYVANTAELKELLHDAFMELARMNIQKASSRQDLMISQAILTLDDLDRTINLFSNRLHEWYGYHFPELSSIITDSDAYVKLIALVGDRSNFCTERLTKEGTIAEKSKEISTTANSSMGATLKTRDIDQIVDFAKAVLSLYESRKELELYLENVMREVAPNMHVLAGATLGARLIAAVGSLENLAKKSSSTIQVLGAEKALFRSISSGSRPPKHGLIFQHKELHQAPKWQRGKIARALASKIAIAARLDAYSGEYKGTDLNQEFAKRVEEIHTKYPHPPKRERRRVGRG